MSDASETELAELVDAVIPDEFGFDDVEEPEVSDLAEATDEEQVEALLSQIRRHRLEEVATVYRQTVSERAEERFSDGWTAEEMNEWRVDEFRNALELFCVDPLLAEPVREAAQVVEDIAEKSREKYPRLDDEK